MSQFPSNFDDDSTLPAVNDNITEIGGDAINSLRDAVFNIEQNIGLGAAGITGSIAARLGVFINTDGTPNASVLTSLGLVTLPITNGQIADNAGIPESKLVLNYRTQDLFNYIQDLSRSVNTALGWISVSGIKLEPHLLGFIYRHDLAQIDVAETSAQFLNNVFRSTRNNTNSYTLISDINNELLAHQWADGSIISSIQHIITNNGSFYPSNYAHTASGIFLDSSRFAVIPQTVQDTQEFANYLDENSIFLLGTRIQNLYSNGISVNSRSSSLIIDGYGQPLVPPTAAIAYLKGGPSPVNVPFDNINTGDDIIQFTPSPAVVSNNSFDEQFALVRPGDIIRVNYTNDGYGVEIAYVISEKKYNPAGSKTYAVRIAGKNIFYSPNAVARIDRSLFNDNKYGVLSTATGVALAPPTFTNSLVGAPPSVIIGHPRGAQCLGIGFTPDEFNETHYFLYLVLYPSGNPLDGYTVMPAIDVTGNAGVTPGSYTLDTIVQATNVAFRQPGFNYRFTAFSYQGEFGIMLSDSYNNASFSVVSAVIDGSGSPSQIATQINFPNNVVDLFPSVGIMGPDPLGFGPFAAGVASPLFQMNYGSAAAAQQATQVFVPLRRNNYYVNGTEQEQMSLDVNQLQDSYGDGYWIATIGGESINPGPPGSVSVTYDIPFDLSASQLKAGKTLVVQPIDGYSAGVNYGRFIISSVSFSCCPPITTTITVYDGVHGLGISPSPIAPIGTQVAIYFNSDAVTFNNESSTDYSPVSVQFKRRFEIYINENAATYSHERGRFSIGGINYTVNGVTMYANANTTSMDLIDISPKLRGYQFGSITRITLVLSSYSTTTGEYTGFLASYNGTITRPGPITTGKLGEIARFFDETNIDYVDIFFANVSTTSLSNFSTNQFTDIQLFPTLSLDQEIMLLSTCQVNDSTGNVNHIIDERQFGNISEEQLTTSALDFISAGDRALHFNGVIRGFDIPSGGVDNEFISLTGGLALVNGELANINDQVITIPKIKEQVAFSTFPINFALCINDQYELVTLPLNDYDPVLGTPNTGDRIMTVLNVVTNNNYQIDSNLFSHILNDRKDLTVLYVISSTVTGTGSGATVSLISRDVRRFVNDADASLPAVLTSDTSQGNFRSLATALNWLTLNSSFQQQLQIKGIINLISDPGLNGNPGLQIIGNGSNATLNFTSTAFISGVTFNNLTITTNSVLSLNTSGTIVGPVVFDNCTIIVTTNQGFAIGSNVTFNNCTFTYNYNASLVTGDLVNAYSGMIYASVGIGETIGNFSLTNNIFTNIFTNRFSFCSLQLNDYTAILENITITGNTFINSNEAEDIRAVVAISTTIGLSSPNFQYPLNPKIINLLIDNNICNQSQMIVLTATPSTTSAPVGAMVGSAPSTINCRISRNTCGVIGYFVSANDGADFTNPSGIVSVKDKSDNLIITQNTCKIIANLNVRGQYQAFGYTTRAGFIIFNHQGVQVPTGQVDIIDNTVSWINVGCYGYTLAPGAGVRISDNRINPLNPVSLANYNNPTLGVAFNYYGVNGITLMSMGVGGTGSQNTQSVIASNTLSQNPLYLNLNPTTSSGPYFYNDGIYCGSSAQVLNNSVNNVVSGGNLIDVSDNANSVYLVSNNTLARGSSSIISYVQGDSSSTSFTVIVDNYFDSIYTDTANTIFNDIINNIPSNWNYTRNTNQVLYCAVPLYSHCTGTNTPFSPTGTLIQLGSLSTHGGQPRSTASFMQFSENGGTFSLQYSFKLSDILPEGVKLLYATVGLTNPDIGGTVLGANGNSFISLALFNNTTPNRIAPPISPTGYTTGSPLTGSIVDVANPSVITSIVYAPASANIDLSVGSNVVAIRGATVFLNMDMSNTNLPPLFQAYTGIENEYVMALIFNNLFTAAASTACEIDISPIVLRYTWI